MKLIIDIPEEVKQTFDNAKNEDLYGNYYDRNSLIGKAIQNGIPLDDLRAEIEQIADEEQKHDKKWAIGLRYAVKIIDRYRRENDE